MLLIGTDEGVYRWAEGNGWPVFHGLQDRAVIGLGALPSGVVAAIDDAGLLWESVDNGLNWRGLAVPDGSGTPVSLAVGGTPGTIAYSTIPLTVYSRAVGSPLAESQPFLTSVLKSVESLSARITSARSSGGTAVAAQPARRRRTVIGWTKLPNPPGSPSAVFRLLHLGETAWFACLQGAGLFRSTDAGVSATKVEGMPAEVLSIRPSPNGLVAATADGVWFSSDDGQTWTSQSAGLESTKYIRVVEPNPSDAKVLLAAANAEAGDSSQGDVLFESNDAGKTWTRVVRSFPEHPRYDRITDIRFDPAHPDNIAVAFASGELWMTRNSGGYWQPFARQVKAARALCPVG